MHLLKSAVAHFILWMAAVTDWIANRLTAISERLTRKRMTETEEQVWDRAATEAGYAPLPDYIERGK